jgi:hypothetical protein
MFYLKPPRHISTLPRTVLTTVKRYFRDTPESRHSQRSLACLKGAIPGQLDGGRGGLPSLVRGPFDCAAIFAVRHHAVLCA